MARPARPERSRSARSSRQLSRFYHSINPDRVFGTHKLAALIKERAAQFGPWPAKMTMLLYRMNDTWEIMISPGKSVQEEEFSITVMWIAPQMQVEFDL